MPAHYLTFTKQRKRSAASIATDLKEAGHLSMTSLRVLKSYSAFFSVVQIS